MESILFFHKDGIVFRLMICFSILETDPFFSSTKFLHSEKR